MTSKLKSQINTLTSIHIFFIFLSSLIILLPFIFLSANSINISFFLFFIALIVSLFLRNKCFSFVIEKKNTHFLIIGFMCLISIVITAAIYVAFYSLGYNHIFFKTPVCFISFIFCIIVSAFMDLFWFYKWKRNLEK